MKRAEWPRLSTAVASAPCCRVINNINAGIISVSIIIGVDVVVVVIIIIILAVIVIVIVVIVIIVIIIIIIGTRHLQQLVNDSPVPLPPCPVVVHAATDA